MSARRAALLLLALCLVPVRAAAAPTCNEIIGQPCTPGGADCMPAGLCFPLFDDPSNGVCSCPCTTDDPKTHLINEDSCPGHETQFCAVSPAGPGLCFKRCQPRFGGNDCQAPLACGLLPGAWGLPNWAACVTVGCTTGAHCPFFTGTFCTSDPAACKSGDTCESGPTGNMKICTTPGTCDLASGLCGAHPTNRPNAKVGDPCKADTDCGKHMFCVLEQDRLAAGLKDHGAPCEYDIECCGYSCEDGACVGPCGTDWRNGYCTVLGCAHTNWGERACPEGSACSRLYYNGICLKTCRLDVASDCRGNPADRAGDYECRAWNNIQITNGGQVATEPVCEPGPMASCLFVDGGATLDCEVLGEMPTLFTPGNPTHMTCRLPDGTPTTDPADPRGICMDDTTSGALPDGGAADAAPDAGAEDAWILPDHGTHDAQPKDKSDDGGCHLAPGGDTSLPLALLLLLLVRRR